jgi:TonB family protein
MRSARSQACSLGLHLLLGLLLLAGAQRIRAPLQPSSVRATPLTFVRPRMAIEPRAGGSNQSTLPARHGSPPRKDYRSFIPPRLAEHPLLALPITIAFDIPIDNSNATIGDPLSRLAAGAFGTNGRNGIADHGCCQGIADSRSGAPGLSVQRGGDVTPPQLIFKVEPEFSEEARKAKHQGVVVLGIEVDSNGNVRNVRVRQSLGLGLDEKAIEAVSRWRFRPGILDGKPVTTEAVVEVNFQLL